MEKRVKKTRREGGREGKGWMDTYLLVAAFEGLVVGGSLSQLAVGRTQKVDGVLKEVGKGGSESGRK